MASVAKGPRELELGPQKYFRIAGNGDPSGQEFANKVEALYALAFAVRMAYRQPDPPQGWVEFKVFPLEGLWSLQGKSLEEARLAKAERRPVPAFDRRDLVYTLQIAQPDFLTPADATTIMARVGSKKKLADLELVRFESWTEGRCVEALHCGPYAAEPATFALMTEFCRKNSLARVGDDHHEIYLNDARKTAPEKLKTLLRFNVRDDYRCL